MTNEMKKRLISSWATNNENFVKDFKDESKQYISKTLVIQSCSDSWWIHLIIKDNIIIDYKYSGTGCVISESIISYLSRKLINKDISKVKPQLQNFVDYILGQKVRSLDLYELVVYEDIRHQPNRINCVLLGPKILINIIEGVENEQRN